MRSKSCLNNLPGYSGRWRSHCSKVTKAMFISLLIFEIGCSTAVAQPYQPVLSGDSIRWNVLFAVCGPPFNLYMTLTGDTIVNSRKYSTISYIFDYEEYILIREDTLNGRLWYYSERKNRDMLLMDLSLEVGDVFYIHHYPDDSTAFHVDSVYFRNDRKHVRLDKARIIQCTDTDTITFIEGVGPNASFFMQEYYYKEMGSIPFYVLCMYRDGELIHVNNYYANQAYPDPCWILGNSAELINNPGSGIIIYPNPATDRLYVKIENNNDTGAVLTIVDLTGRLMATHNLVDNLSGVDISHLPAGIFICKVNIRNRVYSGRIVKMN